MSKNLLKILSICAFVVILPLAILATALCVTESQAYWVRLYVDGTTEGQPATSVLINGKEREKNELRVQKGSEVIITFEGEAYDFDGWYQGNDKTYQANNKVVADKATYSFKLEGATELTAKCKVKTYTFTFGGKYNDGSAITNVVDGKTFVYGDALPEISPIGEGTGIAFSGWMLNEEGIVEGPFKTATYTLSGAHELVAKWDNEKQVSYYDADKKLISSSAYTQEKFNNFELLTEDEVKTSIKAGYTYAGWTDVNGNPINLEELKTNFNTNNLDLYLKLNVINYNLSVKFNPVNKLNKPNTEITYNVETGFSAYKETRLSYTFKGLEYNGTLYTQTSEKNDYKNGSISLGSVLVANNVLDAEVTAIWQADYSKISFNVRGVDETRLNYVQYFDGTEYSDINYTREYEFLDIENGYDMGASLYNTLLADLGTFHKNDAQHTPVTVKSFLVAGAGNIKFEVIETNGNQLPIKMTFEQIIFDLVDSYGIDPTIDTYNITFYFA